MKPHSWLWLMWFFQVEEAVKGVIVVWLFLVQPSPVPNAWSEQRKWLLICIWAAIISSRKWLCDAIPLGEKQTVSKLVVDAMWYWSQIRLSSQMSHHLGLALISFFPTLGTEAWRKPLGKGREMEKERETLIGIIRERTAGGSTYRLWDQQQETYPLALSLLACDTEHWKLTCKGALHTNEVNVIRAVTILRNFTWMYRVTVNRMALHNTLPIALNKIKV